VKELTRLRGEFVIKPADKNLGVTIMDRESYTQECLRHLSDTETYLPNDRSIDTVLEDLRRIRDAFPKAVSKRTWDFIFHCPNGGWRPCAFYIIMKVHKRQPVGRPIAASCAWITNHASMFLHQELMELVRIQETYLQDSDTLLRILEDRAFPRDIILATYDVTALYPSIPLDEAMECIGILLTEAGHPRARLIIRLLDWVMRNSIVEFDGKLWIQIKGTAMGTPVAPAFAILFMSWLDRKYSHAYPTPHLLLHRRYIDDGVIFWGSTMASLQEWLNRFNCFNPNIGITWSASPASVDFLDITIYKGDRFQATGKLDVRCFQKPMNMYLYLPFTSHHTTATKKAFIRSELHRMLARTTDPRDFISIHNKFYMRLRARGYPPSFLRPIFSQVCHHHRRTLLNTLGTKPRREGLSPIVLRALYEPRGWSMGLPRMVKALATTLHALEPNVFPEKGLVAWVLPKKTQNLWVRARLPPKKQQHQPQPSTRLHLWEILPRAGSTTP
jgi:hypothetical protein